MIFANREEAARKLADRLAAYKGKNPLILDSKDPSIPVQEYAYNETRYRMLIQADEARGNRGVLALAHHLADLADAQAQPRLDRVQQR